MKTCIECGGWENHWITITYCDHTALSEKLRGRRWRGPARPLEEGRVKGSREPERILRSIRMLYEMKVKEETASTNSQGKENCLLLIPNACVTVPSLSPAPPPDDSLALLHQPPTAHHPVFFGKYQKASRMVSYVEASYQLVFNRHIWTHSCPGFFINTDSLRPRAHY